MIFAIAVTVIIPRIVVVVVVVWKSGRTLVCGLHAVCRASRGFVAEAGPTRSISQKNLTTYH